MNMMATTLMEPECDLNWLRKLAQRIGVTAAPASRASRFVPADELYAFGLKLMDDAEAIVEASDELGRQALSFNGRQRLLGAAILYRDGLIISMLTQATMRRRNIADLQIGKHLVRIGASWTVVLSADEAKGKSRLDYPLSARLSGHVDRYIQRFPPLLPGPAELNALWVTYRGKKLTGKELYVAVMKRTREGLGRPVNPHFFRHISATYIAVEDPVNAPMIRDLLGHAKSETADQYYKMAGGVAAARQVHKMLELNPPAGAPLRVFPGRRPS